MAESKSPKVLSAQPAIISANEAGGIPTSVADSPTSHNEGVPNDLAVAASSDLQLLHGWHLAVTLFTLSLLHSSLILRFSAF
jgi:hypothetical protein